MDYVQFHRSVFGKVLRKIYRYVSNKRYIESAAAAELGYKINLDDPKTFNEKLAWIKLYDHNPIYHTMVDKFAVKELVTKKLGEGHVAKVIALFESYKDMNFKELPPPPYVIKSVHYGVPIVVKTKEQLNESEIIGELKAQSNTSGYVAHREWGYKDVKPRVMVEEYLQDDSDNNVLQDYKFWCFNGVPRAMYLTVKDKEVYENFYDMDFNPIDINHGFPRRVPEFQKPVNFDKMKEMASFLSEGIPFVRVDFYNIKGQIYFGEYTFFDWGGAHPFITYEQDLRIGEWLQLPSQKRV